MADSEQALAGIQAREAALGGVAALAQADRELEGRLLDRIRDRLLEAPLDSPPVDRVDAAMVDPDPVRPRRALNVLVGTLAGLLLGSGTALLRRAPARLHERPDQVEAQLDVPVIAVMPDPLGEVKS
jgi:tyrosine-protein kinase Etk/Wzc